MAKTQVLLIEDNRLLREGIAAMLDDQGDFEVVAVLAQDCCLHVVSSWTSSVGEITMVPLRYWYLQWY